MREARDSAVQEVEQLTEELTRMWEEMKILIDLVRENRQAALEEQTMRRERCTMFRNLAIRAGNAILHLGVQGYRTPEHLESDETAAFLHLFTMIVDKLESAGTSVDGLVESECRGLLRIAVMWVFSNLRHLDTTFDFSTVLQCVEGEDSTRLGDEVEEHMNAFLSTQTSPLFKLHPMHLILVFFSTKTLTGDPPDRTSTAIAKDWKEEVPIALEPIFLSFGLVSICH
jgi:hypothetical protein